MDEAYHSPVEQPPKKSTLLAPIPLKTGVPMTTLTAIGILELVVIF
ncbi:hypothetical protein [Sphingobacterium siyangense]